MDWTCTGSERFILGRDDGNTNIFSNFGSKLVTMIYDNIKNIGLYKGISAALDVALDYIAAAKMPLEDGTTMLEHGVKAVVSSYVTKEVNPKGYEAHLKYADVQFLLEGAEDIRCCPLEFLTPATEYDAEKDCRFYLDDLSIHPASWSGEAPSAVSFRLGAGYFAVVFPDDAHIPQLAVGTPAEVKKIVMKVPVD